MRTSSLLVLSTICTCMQIALAGIDYTICNPLNMTLVPPPPPQLPQSFTTQIEWKWLDRNMTIDVSEVHNGIRNMSSQNIVIEGQTTTLIYDYVESQYITYSQDLGCVVNGLGSLAFYDNKLWLSALKMIYGIARQAAPTYMGGNYTLRSTRVGMWRACLDLFQMNITVEIDMYFQAKDWVMALSPPDQMVPVRFEMTGSTTHNSTKEGRVPFHVIADIIDFSPVPKLDESQLQVPPGVFCPGKASRKPMNLFPTSFSVIMEKVDLAYKRITYEHIYYDANKRLVRWDSKQATGSDPDPTTDVFDFNLGIHYIMDPYMGTCDPVTALSLGDRFVEDNGNSTIRMQSGNEFFHAQNAMIQYAGTRTARGVTCDVWVGLYLDGEANRNFTIEWYFAKDNWQEAVGSIIQPAPLVRMDIWQGSGNALFNMKPIEWNVIYLESVAPIQEVFNVAPCYPPPHRTRMIVHYSVINNGSLNAVSASYLKDTIHMQLVRAALLPPLRIADASVVLGGDTDLYFDATLLDNAPVTNPHIVPAPPKQHELAAAYDFLYGVLSGGALVQLRSITKGQVIIKSRDIIKIDYSQEFKTTPRTTITSTSQRTPPTPELAPTTIKPATPTERVPTLPPLTPSHSPPSTKPATPCACPKQTCPTAKPTYPTPTQKTCPPPKACVQQTCPTPKCPTQQCPSQKQCPPTQPCQQHTCPTQKPCPSTTVKCPSPTPQLPCTQPTHVTITTNKTPPNLKQTGSDAPSSGVSGGAVGGIAIAMILIGILLGVIPPRVYKHYRKKNPSDKTNILDKYFDNESNY